MEKTKTGITDGEVAELADLFGSLESAQDALACVRRELDAAWQAWRDATDGGNRAEIAETQRTIGRLSVAHMHARETLQEQVREARTAERG